MSSVELITSYTKVRGYSPVEILENIENIEKLVADLLIFSGTFKTEIAKQKYRNLAIDISELLPEDESTYDTGSMFSIGRNNNGIQANAILGIDYDPDKKFEIGEMEIDPEDINDPSIIYNISKSDVITFQLEPDYNSSYQLDGTPFLDETIKKEKLKEERALQIKQFFQIAKKQGINLEILLEAYQSDLWRQSEEKWSDNNMKVEITFLRDIHMNSLIGIESFGENIAIQKLYQNAHNPEISPEDILKNCLDIPCIQSDKIDFKKATKAFKAFFKKSAENFQPGTDILYINAVSGESTKLGMLAEKFNDENDLMYRIHYFTHVIKSLQDQGVKISDFTYNWEKLATKQENSSENSEIHNNKS